MSSQFTETVPQTGSKGCHNCAHRGPKGWEGPEGACRSCQGYYGGYNKWKADPKTLAGYIEAIQKDDKECHFGDSKLNVTPVPDGSRLTSTSTYDIVSKPKHYMLFEDEGIEVRDVCGKLVCKVREGYNVPFWKDNNLFESDYVQMMQYLMRFMDKNGVEDLKKARWYLDKMIQSYE